VIGEHERHGRTLADAEFADRGEILTVQLDRRAQLQGIRPGNGADAEVLPPDPRHDRAVAEAHDQLHAHRHLAAHGAHQADHVDVVLVVGERHEVGHGDRARRGLERGLEDGGAGQIAPFRPFGRILRRDQPAPVLGRAEQRGKAGIRIKVRQTQPVNRAVTADQRPGYHVPDEAVAFDRLTQASSFRKRVPDLLVAADHRGELPLARRGS
jgi:hypothetical protein